MNSGYLQRSNKPGNYHTTYSVLNWGIIAWVVMSATPHVKEIVNDFITIQLFDHLLLFLSFLLFFGFSFRFLAHSKMSLSCSLLSKPNFHLPPNWHGGKGSNDLKGTGLWTKLCSFNTYPSEGCACIRPNTLYKLGSCPKFCFGRFWGKRFLLVCLCSVQPCMRHLPLISCGFSVNICLLFSILKKLYLRGQITCNLFFCLRFEI
jgi:hypothetical protein